MPRPIQVECYAGGRADERPRRLIVGEHKHQITRILEESVEEDMVTRERRSQFTVLADSGLKFVIAREHDGQWYLLSQTG